MEDLSCDVLVVGGAGVDTIVRVERFPAEAVDSVMAPGIADHAGHTGAGVALGCAALGLGARLVEFLGDDPQGDLVRRRLARGGVVLSALPASRTRRAVNFVDSAGRRMSFYDGEDTPEMRVSKEVMGGLLRGARHVHVSIMDFARHVYPLLEGVSTSTDLHAWDGEAAYQEDFAYSSDLVFLSAASLGRRTPDVMRRVLDRGRAHTVIATDGAAGGMYLTREAPEVRPYAPATGAPAVDSNGAGDAFVSGFLYARLNALPLETALRYGAVAGHHACTSQGTHADPITLATLRDRL
ncbi:sugar/nucleoside kinase (ribokinase family) [Actinocorallia herbida]|uniref:Sugar/nucleoside kinase (Ribokinase family) n=1 Tax=Actinocorallia herbida TaxID=58109 RepID=A0A3N1D674_9ACTN|nr:PfkB family carbohydrate kinase [Actinocorallia herbida]ROO88969.1 sugar/nucleoside kinase (ribokinase family) [Actinocorallia herbida]